MRWQGTPMTMPGPPDFTRITGSPRRGYAAIREVDEDALESSTTTTGGGAGGAGAGGPGTTSSSSSLDSNRRKIFHLYSLSTNTTPSESSPLVQITKEMDEKYLARYLQELEQQKETLKATWQEEEDQLSNHKNAGKPLLLFVPPTPWLATFCSKLEVFLANMPLTIGAVGLSWVTLGVIWFKFMEENVDTCQPARYYDKARCTFPEFPGCFACDTTVPIYRVAVSWHYACHTVAGLCCLLFALKLLTGGPLVAEELRNPATSTPMGVVCITMVCVFAGRFGLLGQAIVLTTSMAHVCLAFWFLYQAIVVYRLYPDPGWFPNTVGISYAAVKTWLYFPVAGHVLLVLCCIFFMNLYGFTLFRVARNEKIALPVCFIQLSAPSITMYAITLWAQSFPGQDTILNSDPVRMANFIHLHREYYLPVQHVMLALSLLGMISVLHALKVRWNAFMAKEFSPAHIALVFPILSHTNAIQAYRSGIDAYSTIPPGSWFKICLYVYWVTCLVGGTILCLIFTYHYVIRLPKWTNLSDDDEASLADDDAVSIDPSWISNYFMDQAHADQASIPSALSDAWNSGQVGPGGWEFLSDDMEDAVNPAVLQANETGVMVRVRRGTADYQRFGPYKRTRRVSSVGFDPMLTAAELQTERVRHIQHRRTTSMSLPIVIPARGGGHQRSRTLA